MKENFPNMMKEIDIQVQEVQRVPNKMNSKRPTTRHNIIKMPKVKVIERILKAADFVKETCQAGKEWQEIFKVMKSKDLQPRLLYPAKLLFRTEGQIKSFPGKKKTEGVHCHQSRII